MEGFQYSSGGIISAPDNNGAPVLSNKFQYDYNSSLRAITAAYMTAYTYSGSGKFVGFTLELDYQVVDMKFTIDSTVVFEINIQDLVLIFIGEKSVPLVNGFKLIDDKTVTFQTRFPIQYTSLVKLECKTAGSNRFVRKTFVSLTKET